MHPAPPGVCCPGAASGAQSGEDNLTNWSGLGWGVLAAPSQPPPCPVPSRAASCPCLSSSVTRPLLSGVKARSQQKASCGALQGGFFQGHGGSSRSCVGDRPLGHLFIRLPSQLVGWNKPQHVRAGKEWPRGWQWSGRESGLQNTPLLPHPPVWAQPQSKIPWQWGVLGTPRAFYPGGNREERLENGLSLRTAAAGLLG